jgi:transposase
MAAISMKGADMEPLWLGIDIGKATFVAAVMKGHEALELGEFVNDRAGFVALADAVQAEVSAATIVHVVLEPTGGYEQAAVAFIYEQGWQVSLPNPKQVRDWAKGTGTRAKTDRQDAKVLARYGATRRPASHPPLAQEVNEMDSLLKRRQDLEQMLQQEKNRLQQLSGRPGIAGAVIPSLEEVIKLLEEALETVNQAIKDHLTQHECMRRELKRLLALPGIGDKVGLSLLVLLHRWQTLTGGDGSAKALTAFVGLDPPTPRERSLCSQKSYDFQNGQHRDATPPVYGCSQCRSWTQSVTSLLRTLGQSRESQETRRRCRCSKDTCLGLDTLLPANRVGSRTSCNLTLDSDERI